VVGASLIEPLGIRLGIRPWVRVPDVVPAEAELYEALVERFGQAGIGVPLPRQEVRLLDGAGAR
jgi:small-conductance mechanosensitive channel